MGARALGRSSGEKIESTYTSAYEKSEETLTETTETIQNFSSFPVSLSRCKANSVTRAERYDQILSVRELMLL